LLCGTVLSAKTKESERSDGKTKAKQIKMYRTENKIICIEAKNKF
jgi:hypothetical protein